MPGQSEVGLTALLVAVLLVLILLLRLALGRPASGVSEIIGDQRDDEYQALARKDGVHPDVADAFEEEIRIRGRDIRRKDEERRRRDAGDASAGFDVDPF